MTGFTLHWGIIGAGGISGKFATDLLADPAERGASGVTHNIASIGSRSQQSAERFLDSLRQSTGQYAWGLSNGTLDGCRAVGSYDAVFSDREVDAVYIGLPHSHHYQASKAALLAGKHVLCEKPFTLDLAELDDLIATAQAKKLFLMEAVWTRFLPLVKAVQEVVFSGQLGRVKRLTAELAMDTKPDEMPETHRMISPDLAGGSLLDLGPYPAVWGMLLLHQNPQNSDRAPKVVHSFQDIYERTGVDASSYWVAEWQRLAQAAFRSSMTVDGARETAVVVNCEEGDLVIEGPAYKPEVYHIIPHLKGREGAVKERATHRHPVQGGMGWHYQADEVACCVRDGQVESRIMPLAESRIVQGWFDDVRMRGDSVLKHVRGQAASPSTKPNVEAFSDEGFVNLFDGETLSGWHAVPRLAGSRFPGGPRSQRQPAIWGHAPANEAEKHPAKWHVDQGAIVGEQETPGCGYGGYLVTDGTYGEFELAFDAKPDWPADTGIMVRRARDVSCEGYQILLDHRRSGGIGGFYGNDLAGFHGVAFNVDAERDSTGKAIGLKVEDPATTVEPITPAKPKLLSYSCDPADFIKVWRWEDWNEFRIRCVGGPLPTITSWINGLKIAELDVSKVVWPDFDGEAVAARLGPRGHIAFEVHDNDLKLKEGRWGVGAVCRWRNIRIKDLGER